jgi:hypothetical protein
MVDARKLSVTTERGLDVVDLEAQRAPLETPCTHRGAIRRLGSAACA